MIPGPTCWPGPLTLPGYGGITDAPASSEAIWFSEEVHQDPALYVRALYKAGLIERPTTFPEPVQVTQPAFPQMMQQQGG